MMTSDDDETALPVPVDLVPVDLAPPPVADPRAFTALLPDLRRHAQRLARSAEDADDLVQDTLLRVWARLEEARRGAPDAKPVEDLRAYAFATLRGRATARHGQGLRPVPDSHRLAPPPPALVNHAEEEAPKGTDRLAVSEALAALDRLPPRQARLLRMRAIDGLSYAQIAKVTGLPMGTVTSRMARGRAALRDALDLPEGASVTDLLGPR
ncbi:RNA polymerase sigma factor [Roseibacterium beibuensis]|uniref:RNA polymerase sigma factor n=1 Tax=[Roseibacterium] beibuensis TaxID=1193142 RepID=A0ABP9L3E8_9RHOB|nr:RNA polymerase sigma factor [Roseibacterium beibuensis]MCS6621601.1 RNA polymerase sigma factor [Roseibacterium beibuensis]